jgi:hypothetical protein
MKTPDKIYLLKDRDYNEFERDSLEYVSDVRISKHDTCYVREDVHEKELEHAHIEGMKDSGLFTKKQVINLMREVWTECVCSDVSELTFEKWLEQEKPFDSK